MAIFGCVVLCVSNLLFGRLVFVSHCIGWCGGFVVVSVFVALGSVSVCGFVGC